MTYSLLMSMFSHKQFGKTINNEVTSQQKNDFFFAIYLSSRKSLILVTSTDTMNGSPVENFKYFTSYEFFI